MGHRVKLRIEAAGLETIQVEWIKGRYLMGHGQLDANLRISQFPLITAS